MAEVVVGVEFWVFGVGCRSSRRIYAAISIAIFVEGSLTPD